MTSVRSSKRIAHDATVRVFSNILKKTRIDSGKTPEQLERHLKGVANHWRISILFLVATKEGLTLDNISEALHCNIKTTSEHTRRLVQAGLLQKKYVGTSVAHSLTPYGRKIHHFLKLF